MVLYNITLSNSVDETTESIEETLPAEALERRAVFLKELKSIRHNLRSPIALPVNIHHFILPLQHLLWQLICVLKKSSINVFPLCNVRQYHHQRPNVMEPEGLACLILGVFVDAVRRWASRM